MVDQEVGERAKRKEENWRKRQRKKRARAVAKRERVEKETEEAGEAGEAEGREWPGVQVENVENVENVGDESSEVDLGMDSERPPPSGDSAPVPPPEGGETYDYGVVKGKSKSSVFVHGNYDRYYGYRVPGCGRGGAQGSEKEDPRLGILEKGWFHKKRCLDVGCNEGVFTLSLVKKFRTATMTAIDLDEHLVKRACVNLRKASATAVEEHAKCRGKKQHEPGGLHEEQPQGDQGQNEGRRRKEAKQAMVSLSKTWFVHGNVLASKVERGSFDCITALSVSKWIHLHSGDGGIRAFFGKVRDMLAPGGKFILEPQGWRSYKSAVAKVKRGGSGQLPSNSYFGRLDELKLRPEDFENLLEGEYGLRLIRRLDGKGLDRASGGFGDRHLLVFVKN
jgi:7SK snRNA methylphosphate capping enzyme